MLAKVELSAAFLALAVSNLNFIEKNDCKVDCLIIKLLTRDFKVHMALNCDKNDRDDNSIFR